MISPTSSAISSSLPLPTFARPAPARAAKRVPAPPRLWQPGFLVQRGLERNLADVAKRHFSTETTPRLLDVGCGSMPYRRLFEGRCRDYVGCDPFPQSSGVTRCTTESLRFDDASFDAVVTFQVLEHTRHPWRMMGECARVLKTGGLLVLSASFLLPHQDAPCDYFRFTQEGLMELANDADLAVEEFHAHCTAISTLVLLLNCQVAQGAGHGQSLQRVRHALKLAVQQQYEGRDRRAMRVKFFHREVRVVGQFHQALLRETEVVAGRILVREQERRGEHKQSTRLQHAGALGHHAPGMPRMLQHLKGHYGVKTRIVETQLLRGAARHGT